VNVWDLDTRRETLTLRGHKSFVTSLAYSPDGSRSTYLGGSGHDGGGFGFTSVPLIIDPVLSYSTFLGGSGSDGSVGGILASRRSPSPQPP
jgi:WD40 repeat protein